MRPKTAFRFIGEEFEKLAEGETNFKLKDTPYNGICCAIQDLGRARKITKHVEKDMMNVLRETNNLEQSTSSYWWETGIVDADERAIHCYLIAESL